MRFVLSSCEEWGVGKTANLIFKIFYDAFLEPFEDRKDEWVVVTLTWWRTFFFFFCDVRIPSNKFVNFTGDAVCYCVNIVKYWVQHDGSVK